MSNEIITLRIDQEAPVPMETLIPLDEAEELKEIMLDAFRDYKASGLRPKEWSQLYFKKRLPEKSDNEIQLWAEEIETSIAKIDEKRASILAARKNGLGVNDWFAKDMQGNIAQMSSQDAAAYLKNLDAAVSKINQEWAETVLTKSGAVNNNPYLDGFIAETHHVNSFNADAVAKGSQYRAEVVRPEGGVYQKNSVDIVIKDGNGNIVKRYQSKFGQSAEETQGLFEHGDYTGQEKLVPKGQDVAGSTDRIEMDGVGSSPLSKNDAKSIQNEAQSSGKPPTENYNVFDQKVLLKEVGKNAAIAGVIGAGMSAAFDVGMKLIKDEDIELKEVALAAVKGGGEAAVITGAATAIKIGIEKDVLKKAGEMVFNNPTILKKTPLGHIIAAVHIGVSNVKTMFKIGNGEMTLREGIEEIEVNTAAGVGGVLGAVDGMAAGAAIGTILGPIGTTVGGFVGGVVGGLAGSTVGRAVAKGVQKVREVVVKTVTKTWEKVKEVGSTIISGIKNVGRSILGWLGF